MPTIGNFRPETTIWKDSPARMLLQFKKERNHSNSSFANIVVLQRVACLSMLLQFMKDRSHSYLIFAAKIARKEITLIHSVSAHKGKKPFKWDFLYIHLFSND